ncbi:MAG: cell division topological specificity factor MinE [Eubacteriales bacterium]|nr:cell division topological specificity factor MinE [Eubacteriales bacterium]
MGLMDFFKKKESSKNIAKDRLKLVLVHDRADSNTELLEMIRADILEVIKKYMDYDEEEMDIKISTTESDTSNSPVPALFANIPIRNIHKPR